MSPANVTAYVPQMWHAAIHACGCALYAHLHGSPHCCALRSSHRLMSPTQELKEDWLRVLFRWPLRTPRRVPTRCIIDTRKAQLMNLVCSVV